MGKEEQFQEVSKRRRFKCGTQVLSLKNNNRNQSSQNFRAQSTQSQNSTTQGLQSTYSGKSGRNHLGECRDGFNGYFKCGQTGNFIRECPKNIKDIGAIEPNPLQQLQQLEIPTQELLQEQAEVLIVYMLQLVTRIRRI